MRGRYGRRTAGPADHKRAKSLSDGAGDHEIAEHALPMKRAGASDELAPLAVYLASDSCGYITGQVLFVDGGLTTHL